MWWHRLRRFGRVGFVGIGGGLLAPLVTILLFGGVVLYFRYPLSTFIENGLLLWGVSAPVYMGACLWTWSHMEQRYHATLPVRCPRCGYSRTGSGGAGRCPECGEVLE